MADVKWIKICTDIFDNRKIKQIESLPEGDGILLIWFKLLCLAGSRNDDGRISIAEDIPYTEEALSVQFSKPLQLVKMALEVFRGFHMIDIVDDFLHVSNWERYQNIEGMDKIREQNRDRKKRQRERQKLLSRDRHVTVTQSHAPDIDKEIDIDKDIEINNSNKRKRFIPPTLDEVQAYCLERGNSIDPQRFIDYYTSNGWKVGKNPMKDWKATVRTWERSSFNSNQKPAEVQEPEGRLGTWI